MLAVPQAPPPPPVLDFLPPSLNYQTPQGIGMPHKLKLARWFPFGNTVGPSSSNDIIRFHVKTNDFWDPYSAYLRLEVEIPQENLQPDATPWITPDEDALHVRALLPNDVAKHEKVVQLDGCGHSLIQSLIITEQGNELERIMNYDVIANMLKDVSYGRTVRTTKDYDGLGGQLGTTKDHEGLGGQLGTNFTNNTMRHILRDTPVLRAAPIGNEVDNVHFATARRATHAPRVPAHGFNPLSDTNRVQTVIKHMPDNAGIDAEEIYPQNEFLHNLNAATPLATKYLVDDMIMKKELNIPWTSAQYVDNITQAGSNDITLGGPFVPKHMMHGCPNLGFETFYGEGHIPGDLYNDEACSTNNHYPGDYNNVGQYGYVNPFPANFGTTTFEPMFSNSEQRCIMNGIPAVRKQNIITLYLPIMSGIFGCLMQPNNYKLIPMVAFKDLIFEFQFSPYAFFTSWYDTSYQARRYRINACELHCELAEFMDLTVIRATNEALRNGFTLATQSYYMGNTFNYTKSSVPNTIQINLGFDSLRSIFMVILAGDYLRNSMYRKHYRLSGNITSFQLKIGTDYYPSLPIKGHAGNNYGKENNYEFYVHMLKAFGKLTSAEELGVNPHNFAINWREAKRAENDAKVGNTYRDPKFLRNPSVNVLTGAQLGFFFENRCVGKAIFGLDLDSLNYENAILSGIRTIDAKPFEILLDKSQVGEYDGDSIIHIICYYDLVVSFVNGEVKALGKA